MKEEILKYLNAVLATKKEFVASYYGGTTYVDYIGNLAQLRILEEVIKKIENEL